MAVRFYYSFRSPYAWLAALRLEKALGRGFSRLERIPFWEPDATSRRLLEADGVAFPYRPMSRERHLYILEDVKRISGALGARIRWPVDPPQPFWELAHLAAIRAESLGCGEAFFWAAYGARFLDGRDICASSTIREIARDLGIDGNALANGADDESLRRQGASALASAARDRAFGVPFFVIDGRHRYWGQDRVEDMLADHSNAFSHMALAEGC